MTRETRIALLVGLAFIVLFGLVLGQRSLNLSSAKRETNATSVVPVRARTAHEAVVAALADRDDRPVLAPGGPPPTGRPEGAVVAVTRGPAVGPGTGGAGATGGPPGGGDLVAIGATTRPATGQTYTIASGDTLIRIARKLWGRQHENDFMKIYEANKDKLASPGANLTVGKVLTIPPGPSSPLAAAPGAALPSIPPVPALPSTPVARSSPSSPMVVPPGLAALPAGSPAVVRPVGEGREYVVRKGDTLSEIAKRTMGDGRSALKKLMEANRDRISDPDHLRAGVSLRIPA